MADALAITAASMFNDMQRMSTLSHNLANATTPGFRREIAYTRPFADQLADQLADQIAARPGHAGVRALLPDFRSTIDHRPGTLRPTNAPLDLAIEGDGYFEVQADDGVAYTRQGDFQLDSRGRLVNRSGLPVLGNSGEITLGNGAVRIDSQGRVFEDQRDAGQLRLLRFERPQTLQALGEGLFRAPSEAAAPVESPRVRQAHLENSNVQTTREMVHLIETMRHFEAGQKLIQGVDEILGRAIRTLGEY